ncbi:MAG: murein hydrolase activator EnvC [Acidiferrobacterales bacterium]
MSHLIKSRFLALLLLASLLAVTANVGAATDESKAERGKLRERIDTLQLKLDQTRSERDVARATLRPVERRISQQIRAQRKTREEIAASNTKLRRLRKQQQSSRVALTRQRKALAIHARTAYVLGQQDQFKLLLNQQDPASIGRVFTYYRLYANARVTRMNAIKQDLGQLVQLESRISQHRKNMLLVEDRHRKQSRALEKSRQSRATLLASLNREIRTGAQEIARLKRDEKRLDKVMAELPEVAVRGPNGRRFSGARGRLPPPVRGRVTARFGTRRQLGDLRWKGIFLATPSGREVKAVFGGRVVFADWLQGYGLLLILEHGGGYMTLYGNNEGLTRQLGDRVEAGNVIALTGNTGNIAQSGLYFEVRYQGKPENPLRWCRCG